MTVYDFYWTCMCIICPAVTVLGIIASIIGGVVYSKNKQNNSAKLPLVKKINHIIWGITGFSAFMIVILLINNQVFKEEFSDEKLLVTVIVDSGLAIFMIFSLLFFVIGFITALVFPVIALIFIIKTIVAVIRYFAADKENKEEKESRQRIMVKSFLWDMGLVLAGIFIYYLVFRGLMSFH